MSVSTIILGSIMLSMVLVTYSILSNDENDEIHLSAINLDENLRYYSIEEVSNHYSEEDCWLIIEGKVYDYSNCVLACPGGESILKDCGKDASQSYKSALTGLAEQEISLINQNLDKYFIGMVIN